MTTYRRSNYKMLLWFFLLMNAILAFVIGNAEYTLLVSTVGICLVFIEARISYFSIFSFLIYFCLLQEYFSYTGIEVYGLLNLSYVPTYYFELAFLTIVFILVCLLLLYCSALLEKERALICMHMRISNVSSMIFAFAALAVTILIFPSLPSLNSFSTEVRFSSGILPFTGWSCIPYFFLGVAYMNRENRWRVACISAVVILWFAFHGERVDAIGFLVFHLIRYYYVGRRNLKRQLLILGGTVIILTVFTAIGTAREAGGKLDFSDTLRNVIIQSTACDVTHVFNCAVDICKQQICFGGLTYLSYLINCIPLLNDPYNFGEYITSYYPTVGGGLFFAEPVANFGIAAAVIFIIIYMLLLARLFRKKSEYRLLIYLALCIAVFRTAWYGLNYPITTILYFVPFTLFMIRSCDSLL